MKKYDKVFVIGFNKTATCSIDALFKYNGWKTQHRDGLWETDKFEVFSDQHPDATDRNDFKSLFSQYPNSLFILNVRELSKWAISRCGHIIFSKALQRINKTPAKNQGRSWAYPSIAEFPEEFGLQPVSDNLKKMYVEYMIEKVGGWAQEREDYHKDILNFFTKDPSRLLLVDIHNPWKTFVIDHCMEVVPNPEETGDRMKASDRENFGEVKSLSNTDKKLYDDFMNTHFELVEKVLDTVLSEYPPQAASSKLLHSPEESSKFLKIYKNNFS